MNRSLLYPRATTTRRLIGLDGMWRFSFDPESKGVEAGWALDLPSSLSMPVPASFCDLFTDKASREYCGDFWYETSFFVPAEWSGWDIVLRFGSVTHRARVFVNGVEVAQHEGGFLPFDATVTNIVRYNQFNKLSVLANNELSETMLPAGTTRTLADGRKIAAPYFDFYNYAGIHRPVWLMALPKERVLDYSTRYRLTETGAEIDYTVSTNGPHPVTVELYDGTTRVAESSGTTGTLVVKNAKGQTLVTNAGSNGKYLGVLDLDVKGGKVVDFRYKLLPVFANLIPADPAMDALIKKMRDPFEDKLNEKLAVTEGLLYRRGNFNGAWDQLILDALLAEKNAEIAFSPGFRWGTSLLPGDTIRMEHLLDQTAITYPWTTVSMMTGEQIKTVLEDVCDNLFNPDPYYQQGGDMVRVGGLQYVCDPNARMGARITDMRLAGKPLDAGKTYKVAGWAPVSEEASKAGGEPVWDLVARYLKAQKVIRPRALNLPTLKGMAGNPGMV